MPFELDPRLTIAAVALAGLVIGAALAFLIRQRRVRQLEADKAVLESRLRSQDQLDAERDALLELARERLSMTFEEAAGRSMRSHADTFLKLAQESLGKHHERARSDLTERQQAIENLIRPINEALRKTESQIQLIEKERRESFGAISSHLENMTQAQQALQEETRNLVKALRRPEVRGRWGEITLRRVVELAGMVEHCDFVEQVHQVTSEGAVRPDMVVRMPEGRELVVDAKTPLDAYLEALEAEDEGARLAALARHARNLREHIRVLSGKAYWSQFEHSPEFVVLFVPGDQFLAAALDKDPGMQEDAIRQKVFLTTPTSLVALLKVIAYGWRQVALAENATKIRDLGEELYKRLGTFTNHLVRIGKSLGSSVDAYNNAVGSLERQVLPGARKFAEMGIESSRTVEAVEPVDKQTRIPAPREATSDQ